MTGGDNESTKLNGSASLGFNVEQYVILIQISKTLRRPKKNRITEYPQNNGCFVHKTLKSSVGGKGQIPNRPYPFLVRFHSSTRREKYKKGWEGKRVLTLVLMYFQYNLKLKIDVIFPIVLILKCNDKVVMIFYLNNLYLNIESLYR